MRVLGIPGDGEKTVTHLDAASGWVDAKRLFTLQGDKEEVAKRGVREAIKGPLKELLHTKNPYYLQWVYKRLTLWLMVHL